ncbi:MAG: hypothetical protein ACTIJ7_00255 [Agrococcus casei]|uniref:hypothetical protein n=1 Tax=Agrococcus casei TaxID=343512 RepID=UPI003F9C3688
MSDLMREVQYGIPQFGVLIPAGFERVAISDAMYDDAERVWREKVADEQALQGVLAHLTSVRRQHDRMRAFGMIMPRHDSESPLPLSILFSDLGVAPGRQALDELRALMQRGAGFVDDDQRMLRLERVESTDIDGETVTVRTRSLFVRVPYSCNMMVLVIAASVTEVAGRHTLDQDDRDGLWEVADAVAASFTWFDRAPIELSATQLATSVAS